MARNLVDKPWHDQYPDYWPRELDYPEITVPEMLRRRTAEFSENTAFIFEGREYSYAQLQEEVDKVAAGLSNLGVGKGDRVSLCMPNCPQFVFAFYGIMSVGAVTVHTSFMYSERELEYQLNDAGASIILASDKYVDKVANVVEDTDLEKVVVTSLATHASPTTAEFLTRSNEDLVAEEGFHWYEDFTSHGTDYPEPDLAFEDLASLIYTGGTTGFPKGVKFPHRTFIIECAKAEVYDLVAYDDDLNVTKGDTTVSGVMPMFHGNGNISGNLFAIYNGSSVVLYPKFDPATLLRDIEQYEINHMHLVPTMVTGMLEHERMEETDFSSLRHTMVASAPVPVEHRKRWREMTNSPTYEGYGATEVLFCTVEPPTNQREGSCGLPVPTSEVDVVDPETGDSLGPGEVGELIVKSETLTPGYWQKPEKTEKAIRDGWFHSGDLGYRDEDWFFYYETRMDNMIVTSGHNVYPAEIENVLYEHDAVKEAAVIGVPDDYRGKNVAAFVEPVPDTDLSQEEFIDALREMCERELANYKQPREFTVREIPTTDVGKISKKKLKEDVLDDPDT